MASRFWAGDSSSDEESVYSENSDVEQVNQTAPSRAPAARWNVDSDSDSDDEKRVVKSAKEKAVENLKKSCESMKNHIKINDWIKLHAEYDGIAKSLDKAKNYIKEQGHPRFFIKSMVELEDFMTETMKNKSTQKSMNKMNNKSFVRMKKRMKELDESITKAMKEYREGPESEEEASEESSSEEESSDEEESSEVDSEEESEELSGEDEESGDESEQSDEDSDDWPSQEDSESSSESEDDDQLKGRAKWLKKTPVVKVGGKVRDTKPKEKKVEKEKVVEVKKVEELLNLTPGQFDRRLKEVSAMRGKKGTFLNEQIGLLIKLASYSRTLDPAREIVSRMQLIGAQVFDTSNKIDKVISTRLWLSILSNLEIIMKILEENPDFTLVPLTAEDHADILRAGRNEGAENEDFSPEVYPQVGGKGKIRASGQLSIYLERLSDEYNKSLQQMDPHKSDYISRLFDEGLLLSITKKVQAYYERKNDFQYASAMALIRAECLYYKHNTIAAEVYASQMKRKQFGDPSMYHPSCTGAASEKTDSRDFSIVHPGSVLGSPVCKVEPVDFEKELTDLCMFIYKNGDDRSKTRAMLCHIYHHALHDRFFEARDLLLMSHLQDTITHTDISTQILFNRMMAQLGLCAFRIGRIQDAHSCLSEICSGSKTKELLAQGVQSYRYHERDEEQEKLEKRRLMPYHMHINLELLECCHLTSAMLLEVPNLVAINRGKPRFISKTFRKLLDFHDRLVFCGPPENARDHIVSASKFMAQGLWKQATDCILGMSVWNLFPGKDVTKNLKEMVKNKIQVQALRSYLLAYSSEYDSMNLPQLTEMFKLPVRTVHSVVSKMMINEELHASWDQSSQSILLRQVEKTKLQRLALQYADKISVIVENNERMLDFRASFSSKDEWKNRGNYNSGNNKTSGGNRQASNRGNFQAKKSSNSGNKSSGGGNRW